MSALEARDIRELAALVRQPWLQEPRQPFFCRYLFYSSKDWLPILDDEIEEAMEEERPHE